MCARLIAHRAQDPRAGRAWLSDVGRRLAPLHARWSSEEGDEGWTSRVAAAPLRLPLVARFSAVLIGRLGRAGRALLGRAHRAPRPCSSGASAALVACFSGALIGRLARAVRALLGCVDIGRSWRFVGRPAPRLMGGVMRTGCATSRPLVARWLGAAARWCYAPTCNDGQHEVRRCLARWALVARATAANFSCGGGAAAGRRSGDAPTMS
ncbi:hypothetical protein F511_46065 [Dorcoceras hygrometricum]|uniref:Uncharacterized protein n=1 Tax=Dorcoceras hygrometricum TaxID=472368 RepID=A0A2Z7A1Y5_9LAMI|nr:hypothetical protein F511_46065 [Dorcoceras hygrometricum]